MKLLLGFLLFLAGFLGLFFFSNYIGNIIPIPWFWEIVSLLFIFLGIGLISGQFHNKLDWMEEQIDQQNKNFKKSSKEIDIILDNCEFKSGSYVHELPDTQISYNTKLENINSSYLIFQDEYKNKYISQSFSVDKTTLQYYVLSRRLKLYAKPGNSKQYIFLLDI